jgi:drug/metabolite transporter (DMT)-like permease
MHRDPSRVRTPRVAVAATLAAALLFGASTPFAKILTGEVSPLLLAGLLYLGSGLGLWTVRLLRDRRFGTPRLLPREWWWFLSAIAAGGVAGPVLLLHGLMQTSAASASLLLNLEAVFTALLAWLVFREHTDRRLVSGMVLIVLGGVVLAWTGEANQAGTFRGAMFIAAACVCWAADNNLTRKISAIDADFIAGTKGLLAGATNLALAAALGARLPAPSIYLSAMAVGLAGYGASLVLFVIGLRALGSARASAYFSTAPFFGVAIALLALHDSAPAGFWLSAVLMAAGVALHLTERHSHQHTHLTPAHAHPHVHDAHHRHAHDFEWDGTEPHSHEHGHDLTHDHPHYPDLHHRHGHS